MYIVEISVLKSSTVMKTITLLMDVSLTNTVLVYTWWIYLFFKNWKKIISESYDWRSLRLNLAYTGSI